VEKKLKPNVVKKESDAGTQKQQGGSGTLNPRFLLKRRLGFL
jgi:hypothetical protein